MMQAIGAERIEALCDAFCRAYGEEAGPCHPRISPGYGDFPLEAQRRLLPLLDGPRRSGLTLNGSLFMSPTKSVTAIVGIGGGDTCTHGGCAECGRTECAFRKK